MCWWDCIVYKFAVFTEILLILFLVILPRSTSTLQNNYIAFHNIFTPSIKGYFRWLSNFCYWWSLSMCLYEFLEGELPDQRVCSPLNGKIGILVACWSHPSLPLLKHPQALRENVLWVAPRGWEGVAFVVVVSRAWSWHQAAHIIGHSSLCSSMSVNSLSSYSSRHRPNPQAPTHQSKCWWVFLFYSPPRCRFLLFLCLGWSLAGEGGLTPTERTPDAKQSRWRACCGPRGWGGRGLCQLEWPGSFLLSAIHETAIRDESSGPLLSRKMSWSVCVTKEDWCVAYYLSCCYSLCQQSFSKSPTGGWW